MDLVASSPAATFCALFGGYKGAVINDGVRAVVVLLIAVTAIAYVAWVAPGIATPSFRHW